MLKYTTSISYCYIMHTHPQVSFDLPVFVVDLLMPNSEPQSVCDVPQCSHHPDPSPQLPGEKGLLQWDSYSWSCRSTFAVQISPMCTYVPLQCNSSLLTHSHSPKMHVCVHSHVLAHTHNVSVILFLRYSIHESRGA